jgi:hypothetical protein
MRLCQNIQVDNGDRVRLELDFLVPGYPKIAQKQAIRFYRFHLLTAKLINISLFRLSTSAEKLLAVRGGPNMLTSIWRQHEVSRSPPRQEI